MAVAGLVMGILAMIIALLPCVGLFAYLPAFLGVVFGAFGLRTAKETGQGKGPAKAGLILSVIAMVWIPFSWFVVRALIYMFDISLPGVHP